MQIDKYWVNSLWLFHFDGEVWIEFDKVFYAPVQFICVTMVTKMAAKVLLH
jgi:hypothetical protein